MDRQLESTGCVDETGSPWVSGGRYIELGGKSRREMEGAIDM